jgi:hypothetical protein
LVGVGLLRLLLLVLARLGLRLFFVAAGVQVGF